MGDSFFDVFFMVSLDGDYLFDADVSWVGDFPTAHAFVTLEEDVPGSPMLTGTTIASVSAGPGPPGGASDSDTMILSLMAGTPYQLRAVAHIDGGGPPSGSFAGTASYGFTLTAVPESGAWLLTAPVAMGLAIAAWRRRRA
jgi:hypothetical protein